MNNSEFSVVFDKSKLKRTEYESGRYYTSKTFKTAADFEHNYATLIAVEERRKRRGRKTMKVTLK